MQKLAMIFSVVLSGFLFSFSAQATLKDGAKAVVEYHTLPVYDVLTIEPKVKFVPASATNVPYYDGYVLVSVLVEGNLCNASEKTLGTLEVLDDGDVVTKVVVGGPATDEMAGCLDFSSPSKITFKVKVGMIPDFKERGINEVLARIPYQNQMTRQPGVAQVTLEAIGSQIKVSLKK